MRTDKQITKQIKSITLNLGLLSTLVLSGCASIGGAMNPFAEPIAPEALMGERTDKALYGGTNKGETARVALETMASYRRALPAEPNFPVVQPAVVRLMWIPDHLNSHGDLVPAHYYYLKVLSDRWAVQDAFELEGQLGSKTDSSNIPYVYSEDARNVMRGK